MHLVSLGAASPYPKIVEPLRAPSSSSRQKNYWCASWKSLQLQQRPRPWHWHIDSFSIAEASLLLVLSVRDTFRLRSASDMMAYLASFPNCREWKPLPCLSLSCEKVQMSPLRLQQFLSDWSEKRAWLATAWPAFRLNDPFPHHPMSQGSHLTRAIASQRLSSPSYIVVPPQHAEGGRPRIIPIFRAIAPNSISQRLIKWKMSHCQGTSASAASFTGTQRKGLEGEKCEDSRIFIASL